jgi:ubiquinone/menaquinone biosynthesis C-methylase UbiE
LGEFTGERVIPDQVEPDLWSEHLARYAFASRYTEGKRVLDCGCGTGYGTAELAQTAGDATGLDLSNDAIEYARAHYARPNTRYIAASCLDLPFPDGSFDLIVAFEVIEHLTEFHRFLDESARVLAPSGLFIVSTPNKLYYTESRAKSGPNPFHEHEFEAAEFHAELNRLFPHVTLLVQNRVECFSFATTPLSPADACLDGDRGPIDDAHFFIALCSTAELPHARSFVYVPRSVNLLREREHHIQLLNDELRTTHEWLTQTQQDRNRLLARHTELHESYEAQNRWATRLDADLKAAYADLRAAVERIEQLQNELATEQNAGAAVAAGYESKVREVEAENVAKTQWAIETDQRLSAEIQRITQELAECVRLLHTAEDTAVERTVWAQELEARLNAVRASRWVKLGRKLGLGPAVQ